VTDMRRSVRRVACRPEQGPLRAACWEPRIAGALLPAGLATGFKLLRASALTLDRR